LVIATSYTTMHGSSNIKLINDSSCFPVLIQTENATVSHISILCMSAAFRKTGRMPAEWKYEYA